MSLTYTPGNGGPVWDSAKVSWPRRGWNPGCHYAATVTWGRGGPTPRLSGVCTVATAGYTLALCLTGGVSPGAHARKRPGWTEAATSGKSN